jgi:hypothetical protein
MIIIKRQIFSGVFIYNNKMNCQVILGRDKNSSKGGKSSKQKPSTLD